MQKCFKYERITNKSPARRAGLLFVSLGRSPIGDKVKDKGNIKWQNSSRYQSPIGDKVKQQIVFKDSISTTSWVVKCCFVHGVSVYLVKGS